jgi:hypothetical protein
MENWLKITRKNKFIYTNKAWIHSSKRCIANDKNRRAESNKKIHVMKKIKKISMSPTFHQISTIVLPVLVLACTVVTVQAHRTLTQPIIPEEMVQIADDSIGPLADRDSLVNQVVHLLGEALTAHPENATISRCQEVQWARLSRVAGDVDLAANA